MMRRSAGISFAIWAALALAGIARADELHLKDGSKIVGTIVGYENDSFKVQTSYGFALVRKDRVAEIIPSSPKSDAEPSPRPASSAQAEQPIVPQTTQSSPASVPVLAPEQKRELSSAIAPPKPAVAPSTVVSKPPVIAATGQRPSAQTVAAAPDAPPPPASPEPPVIHDEVSGSLYLNHTYGFQMYKPPSWDLQPDERSALPNAVAALGTDDQTTLLVIGLEPTRDALDAQADATEKALGEIYDNYRALSSRHTSIGDIAAIERRARGLLDGHDWSVIVVTFLHAGQTYTLLGMTYADDDLIQVQENVITKAMYSLTFATPSSAK